MLTCSSEKILFFPSRGGQTAHPIQAAHLHLDEPIKTYKLQHRTPRHFPQIVHLTKK